MLFLLPSRFLPTLRAGFWYLDEDCCGRIVPFKTRLIPVGHMNHSHLLGPWFVEAIFEKWMSVVRSGIGRFYDEANFNKEPRLLTR